MPLIIPSHLAFPREQSKRVKCLKWASKAPKHTILTEIEIHQKNSVGCYGCYLVLFCAAVTKEAGNGMDGYEFSRKKTCRIYKKHTHYIHLKNFLFLDSLKIEDYRQYLLFNLLATNIENLSLDSSSSHCHIPRLVHHEHCLSSASRWLFSALYRNLPVYAAFMDIVFPFLFIV